MVSQLRSQIQTYCGANASNIQIMVTETNSVYGDPGKQSVSTVNALFAADDVMTWLENGVSNVDWWAAHNSPEVFKHKDYVTSNGATITRNNFSSSLFGTSNFGDFGMLSTGKCVTIPNGAPNAGTCWTDPTTGTTITEPAAETPFPTYYGLQMLTHAMTPGSFVIPTASSQPLVTIHANGLGSTCNSSCSVEVLFINKDPNNSYSETLSLGGEVTTGTATEYVYGENSTAITSSTFTVNNSKTFTLPVNLPPYSLVAVDLPNTSYFCFC
jgi:hypothetical protein